MLEVFKTLRDPGVSNRHRLSPNLLSSDFLMSSVSRIFSASFALIASWDIEKQKIKLQTQTCCRLPASSSPPQPIWNSPAHTPAIETWQVRDGMARWRHDQIWHVRQGREDFLVGGLALQHADTILQIHHPVRSPSLFLKKFVGSPLHLTKSVEFRHL